MEEENKVYDIWDENDNHGIKAGLEELEKDFQEIEKEIINFLLAKSVRKKEEPSVKARLLSRNLDDKLKKLRDNVNKQRQDFHGDYS